MRMKTSKSVNLGGKKHSEDWDARVVGSDAELIHCLQREVEQS